MVAAIHYVNGVALALLAVSDVTCIPLTSYTLDVFHRPYLDH